MPASVTRWNFGVTGVIRVSGPVVLIGTGPFPHPVRRIELIAMWTNTIIIVDVLLTSISYQEQQCWTQLRWPH